MLDLNTIILAAGSMLLGTGSAITVVIWFLNRKAVKEDRLAEKLEKAEEKDDILKLTIRMILEYSIKDLAEKHMVAGFMTMEDLKHISDLHDSYQKHGGNGVLDRRMRDVDKLPIRSATQENAEKEEARIKSNIQELPLILAVDDSGMELNIIQGMLEDIYRIHTLADPTEIEPYLNRNTPTLIILDYLMPELTGLDLIPIIKKYPEHNSTPIIMLTGDDSSTTMGAAIDLGVSAFLTKPFSTKTLKDAVAKHIKK